jgi:mRNA-degrading endonuclease RelE of RelBE toxin-antitoxin system
MQREPEYELRVIDRQVQDKYEDLSKEYDELKIEQALMGIKENPRHVSKLLNAGYEGFRFVVAGNIRIIFVCCDECIGWGNTEKIDCADCESIHGSNQENPQKIIKLFKFEDISAPDRP